MSASFRTLQATSKTVDGVGSLAHELPDVRVPPFRVLGLYAVPVAGDGNCLFHALTRMGLGADHAQGCQRNVQYLDGHREVCVGEVGAEFGEKRAAHIARMRVDGAEGEAVDLAAAARLYGVQIAVINPFGNELLFGTPGQRRVHIVWDGAGHYEATRAADAPALLNEPWRDSNSYSPLGDMWFRFFIFPM